MVRTIKFCFAPFCALLPSGMGTLAMAGISPPAVTNTIPVQGETGVSRSADILVEFGVSISNETVTEINKADTDGDGASDGNESATMTNPLDPGAFLAILSVDAGGGLPSSIEWSARGGKSYSVLAVDDLNSPGSAIVITNVRAAGGISPWFETTATADDVDVALPANRSYFIEVAP
jgi:hypothetical protein